MSEGKVQQTPRKGFRQERAPTKGQVEQENQTLAKQLATKILNVEMQLQFMGNMMGQTIGNIRQLSPEVEVLSLLVASTVLPDSEAAQKGDLVMVDYAGVLLNDDGTVAKDEDGLDNYFKGGSGLKFVIRGLGQGTLLPEFETAIEGRKAGETFDLSLTFPEKYAAKELASKKARFTVTVHRVSRLLEQSPTEKAIRSIESQRATVMRAKAEAKAAADAAEKATKASEDTTATPAVEKHEADQAEISN